jgi:hypothetical protein
MKRRSRGREFKSLLLHTSVSGSADIAENRSKSARVRAICDRARTQGAALFLQFAESGQFLSRRDLLRSADHRHRFASAVERSLLDVNRRAGCGTSSGLHKASKTPIFVRAEEVGALPPRARMRV